MPAYEQVSPELIVNVLGKEYFTVSKKPRKTHQKNITGGNGVCIGGDLFQLLAVH
jgi:hypothetical protein